MSALHRSRRARRRPGRLRRRVPRGRSRHAASRSSTPSRTLAAPASTSAASRRRRCCTPPSSSTTPQHAASWGVTFGAAEDRHQQAPRLQGQGPRASDQRHRPAREGAQIIYVLRRGHGRRARRRSSRDVRGRTEQVTFESRDRRDGLAAGDAPGLSIDSPRILDSTGALDLQDVPSAARGRRRLHRARARQRLRRARQRGHGRRDDAGPAAGRRRDLVAVLAKRSTRSARRSCSRRRSSASRREGRHRGHLRGASGAPREQVFDQVLVAVGRRPNAMRRPRQDEGRSDPRGFIEVDAQRRTAEPTLFAIGDVAGEPMLAHKASHEGARGRRGDCSARRGLRAARDPGRGLHRPELAWAGLTETDAQKQGRKVGSRSFRGARPAARSPWIGPTGSRSS